jgi:hypothetical protein
MNTYDGVDVQIHVFFTSALVGGEWTASRPCRSTPAERVIVPIEQETGKAPEPAWTIRRSKFFFYFTGNRTPILLPSSQSLYRLLHGLVIVNSGRRKYDTR